VRYRNARWGFCVRPVPGWTDSNEGVDRAGAAFFYSPVHDYSERDATIIRVGALPNQSKDLDQPDVQRDLGDYAREFATELAGSASHVQVSDPIFCKLNGVPAVSREATFIRDSTDRYKREIFALQGGQVYMLTLECPLSQRQRFEPAFQVMVQTFHFRCPTLRR